jgi:hypothetical protein
MKKLLALILLLNLMVIVTPSRADAAVFSVTTATDAAGAVLMDGKGTTLSTLIGSQTANGQTVWTFQVTDNGAETVFLYTKDAAGNWMNTGLSYPMRWIFPNDISTTGGEPSPSVGDTNRPWPMGNYLLLAVTAHPLPEDQRVQSRCGPAKTYHGAGAYKTYKMTSTNALFIEGSYMLVDMNYTTVGHRRVYFPVNAFSGTNNVPQVTLNATTAYTIADLIPTFGPGVDYDPFDEAAITAGTAVDVFFEENGWVFAEFECALGRVRAWIPTDQISVG